MHKKLYVGIAGNIGTGKSTITQKLADLWSATPHFESVIDNPYLEDFYADMARWSFPLQIFFLNSRFMAHKAINLAGGVHIQDRTIYEDANIFAPALKDSGQMSQRDFDNYQSVYRSMLDHLEHPDLIVYLKKSVPKLLERIELRNRSYEKAIPPEYLLALNTHYDNWIEAYPGRKLVIDSDDLDFLHRSDDFDHLVKQIEAQTATLR